MIWVTGDTHFYHANIIQYTCRLFSDAWEMAQVLRANWNDVVPQDDTVYVLGDFAMDRGYEHEVKQTFEALRGRKRLLRGNHGRRFVLELPWEAVGNEEAVDGVILVHDGEKYAGLDAPVFCSHLDDPISEPSRFTPTTRRVSGGPPSPQAGGVRRSVRRGERANQGF